MNPKLQLRPLPSADAIAQAAATEWIALLKRRADRSVPFGVGLSGGRIAKKFYETLVAAAWGDRTDFTGVQFFWADERCVPPSDPENNYSIARQSLFESLSIPQGNIHRIRGEVDAEYAVKEAEAELCRIMPLNEVGQPVLDVIFLGMGEDGHVASLFPQESAELVADPRVYRKVIATKPPPERITLGYRPILSAREVLVLASGAGKAEALKRLEAGDQSLPIARVVAGRSSTTVLRESFS